MGWLPGATTPGTKAKAPVRSKRAAPRRSVSRKRPSAPSYQLHPEPARYAEIQKALAERGYFKGEPNGEWNDDSVEALRRFQADQKLPDDGKLTAPSLTALGLGPRHDGASAANASPGEGAKPETPPQ
jgi:peptidoglycan hydrolase-like protein with peptidoglycan-binding domain